ncbi:MAG TPA: PAC2 family protein [Dehalococcoidia bacterium]|nr:PAC2 family protein [Dehalococcoidia bacterium]
MTPLRIVDSPDLREPVMIAAFTGWSDAGAAASAAAAYLADRWRTPLLAEIDPEEFYDFTALRPTVRWVGEVRELEWPENKFYYHRLPEKDLIVLVGVEPHLKWKTYLGCIMEVLERFKVSTVITLGAMFVDFPHTRPVRITGTAPTDEMAARAGIVNRARTGRYQGPTGISGVLTTELRARNIPVGSLWANVPHYVSATPNPTASLALLQALGAMLEVQIPLGRMIRASAAFRTQLEEATSKNAEVSEYVRALEERLDAIEAQAESENEAAPELPPAESILQDVEEFFRRGRDQRP